MYNSPLPAFPLEVARAILSYADVPSLLLLECASRNTRDIIIDDNAVWWKRNYAFLYDGVQLHRKKEVFPIPIHTSLIKKTRREKCIAKAKTIYLFRNLLENPDSEASKVLKYCIPRSACFGRKNRFWAKNLCTLAGTDTCYEIAERICPFEPDSILSDRECWETLSGWNHFFSMMLNFIELFPNEWLFMDQVKIKSGGFGFKALKPTNEKLHNSSIIPLFIREVYKLLRGRYSMRDIRLDDMWIELIYIDPDHNIMTREQEKKYRDECSKHKKELLETARSVGKNKKRKASIDVERGFGLRSVVYAGFYGPDPPPLFLIVDAIIPEACRRIEKNNGVEALVINRKDYTFIFTEEGGMVLTSVRPMAEDEANDIHKQFCHLLDSVNQYLKDASISEEEISIKKRRFDSRPSFVGSDIEDDTSDEEEDSD